MADSRNKGASFERKICKLIKDNLNYDAKRNLDQYQAKGQADIVIPGWSIECKAYQKGTTYKKAWLQQTRESAKLLGLTPVLIYKFNNCPIKCVISLDVLSRNFSAGHDLVCEVDIDTWFYIVRERDG
tara:strand:- start:173 stop:556 length:384 start_codon:yes stop_codon:yes gene_type:complete